MNQCAMGAARFLADRHGPCTAVVRRSQRSLQRYITEYISSSCTSAGSIRCSYGFVKPRNF